MNLKEIDKKFNELLKTNRNNIEIINYIESHYITVLYEMTKRNTRLLKLKASHINSLSDQVSELVIDTIETVERKFIDDPKSFKGNSAFSTYLFGILKNKVNENRRVEYPKKIQREGSIAMELYNTVVVKDMDYNTALNLVKNRYNITNYEFNRIYNICIEFKIREQEKSHVREFILPISYDNFLESGCETVCDNSVENEFFSDIEKNEVNKLDKKLRENIKKLPIVQQKLVEERFFGKGKTFKELEENLNITNASYELKKSLKSLRLILSSDIEEISLNINSIIKE